MSPVRLPRLLGVISYDLFITLALIFVAAQWFPLIPETLQQNGFIIQFKRFYILAIAFLYFGYSWHRGGRTIGMKAWHVKLLNVGQENRPVSWRQCAIRYLVALLSWLAAGIGYLWIIFDRQHRSWHDIASGTRLVKTP